MAIFKRFGWKKRRKYPIKRDETGRSARSRCFEMFEERIPTGEIAERVGIKTNTVSKYYQQWKKNPKLEQQLAYFKGLLKKTAPDRELTIELVSKICGITKEQVEEILHQPHGLRRILTGKFYFPAHANADHKRRIALQLALLISDHLIKNGGKFQDVYFAFRRYIQENMKYREEEDADIEEENKIMALFHQILAADIENERQGRVKRDTFSEEERKAITRLGVEQEMKKLEIAYWLRIGTLKVEGLTTEQAREKTYQDLLKDNDLKGAMMIREFQDKIHPLGKNDD